MRDTVESEDLNTLVPAVDTGPVPDPKPILIVLHQPHSNPGHIGQVLRQHGHVLDVRWPRYGDPLPETLSAYDGAVIFGGPMSANDPDDYVKIETDWIGVALKENAPFLGVCLGAQMLAKHLGGSVQCHCDGHVEIGYHPIWAERSAFGEVLPPRRVFQWHKEGFSLTAGCELLVRGGDCFPNQAFKYGQTAIGVQFHPEITYAMISRWTGHNLDKLKQPGAQDRASQMMDHIAHGPAVRNWLDQLLRNWVLQGRMCRASR